MSDPVKCEQCERVAYRRRFRPAPECWLYLEDETMLYVVCSRECAERAWKPGPGPGSQAAWAALVDKERPVRQSERAAIVADLRAMASNEAGWEAVWLCKAARAIEKGPTT